MVATINISRDMYPVEYRNGNAVNSSRDWDRRKILNQKRREQIVRRRILLLVCLTIMMAIAVISFTTIVSKAQAKEQTVYFKYYSNVMVRSGDTLTSIAEDFIDEIHYESVSAYIDEVVYMNHLDSADDIHAGEYLIVPYYSSKFKK